MAPNQAIIPLEEEETLSVQMYLSVMIVQTTKIGLQVDFGNDHFDTHLHEMKASTGNKK